MILIPLLLSSAVGPEHKSDFERLYRLYREEMYRAAYRVLRDRAQAEDVVHDAFLSLAKRFGELRGKPDGELERYLVSVTRYKALAAAGERKRFAELPQTLPAPEDAGASDLERCVSLLPPGDALLIRLRFVEGFTCREIGARLRLSEDAVRMRVKRAKDRLRAILIENGFEGYFR